MHLASDHRQQRRGRLRIGRQDAPRIAQAAQLHRKAEPVVVPTPLTDDGQVVLAQRVMPDE